MAFHITHRDGGMDSNVPFSAFESLFEEAESNSSDIEHGSVSVTEESEWNLGYYGNGYLILENLEEGGERHMKNVSRETVIKLWILLAKGRIEEIKREPWQPGYQ